jgi:glucose/arabinose dehydrogenase
MPKLRLCLLTYVAVLVAALLGPQAIAQAAAPASEPVTDPIPEDPVPSSLALTLQEFAAFPKSEPTPPPIDARLMRWARINYIGEMPDGSGRRYVPDLNGKLYFVKHGTPRVYLDVGAEFAPDFFSGRGLGTGFGFVTFDPNFARNGRFYTTHSEAGAALTTKIPDYTQPNAFVQSVVTEWTAANPAADTFRGTHRELLRIGFSSQIHAIQQIDFNPTASRHDRDYGLLYLAVGEGGNGVRSNDPQNLAIPHGKILRIDPRGTNSTNGRYGIPRSNPFVGRPGVLGEIYAYGFRDPHRFSWDPGGSHRLLLGHIGEHDIEAVDDVRAGDNFGWSEREGPFVFDKADPCNLFPLPADDATFGYTYPVAAFDHNAPPGWPCTKDVGHAISGGFVYRGHDVPALRGKYVFGDLVDGRILYTEEREMRRGAPLAKVHEMKIIDRTGRLITTQDLVGDTRVDLRFGTDRRGELYLLAKANGKIWKVTGTRRAPSDVLPRLRRNVVAHYDFEHPMPSNPAQELDQGSSGTRIDLINGGAAMRVPDGAHRGSTTSIQLGQVNPTVAGNDDWKAGIYRATGVRSLAAFNGVTGTTVMAWVKMTGVNPSPDSNTADPADRYGAVGLTGILSGDSDGHAVRALLELINVSGELRLVALGRRIDGGSSQTFAASAPWQTLLPPDTWVSLAATFDFNTGAMALYKDGRPVPGFYVLPGDPWGVAGPGRHPTSATDPRGIKIGGSFPQDTLERNPCNCRMDSLMFLDRAISPREVQQQYRFVTSPRSS